MGRAHDTNLLEVLMEFGLDLRARRVYLQGSLEEPNSDFSDDSGKRVEQRVVRSLQYLDKTPGTIWLWISTPGGEVSHMFSIYDAVRLCKNEVVTVGTGEVCSAGALLIVCGDRRYATENCWLMSHADRMTYVGDVHATADRLRAGMRQERRFAELMGRHTKKGSSWWYETSKSKRELWLDAKQMIAYGIVDGILEP